MGTTSVVITDCGVTDVLIRLRHHRSWAGLPRVKNEGIRWVLLYYSLTLAGKQEGIFLKCDWYINKLAKTF